MKRVKLELISETILPDGRKRREYNNGGIVIMPPLPGKVWQDRVARELYRISREIAQSQLEQPPETSPDSLT